MKHPIKYVVLDDRGLTIAIRNTRRGYAKTHGGDAFNPETGIAIATKKLRIKELNAGIAQAKVDIKFLKEIVNEYQTYLAKEEKKLSGMLTHRETIVDELHEVLLNLTQN